MNGGSTLTNILGMEKTAKPQWSPPMNRGSATTDVGNLELGAAPQWSPPMNGGSTSRSPGTSWPRSCRNGARR